MFTANIHCREDPRRRTVSQGQHTEIGRQVMENVRVVVGQKQMG